MHIFGAAGVRPGVLRPEHIHKLTVDSRGSKEVRETREQTKPKSSCRNQEFSETEIRFWFRSGTFSGFLVSVSVPGFKIFGLPGYAGSSALNSWFNQELPG